MGSIWKENDRKDFITAPFTLFEKRTPLLTAGDEKQCNTMTIAWGGIGTMWRKPVCSVYVRPQRYTFELMEKYPFFTVSFFSDRYKREMGLCGAKSGRDMDKIKACHFTTRFSSEGAPYFDEADLVLVCRTLYAGDLRPEQFRDLSLDTDFYPQHDYHRMYMGEICRILERTNG